MVAKGVDLMAARIREVATEHKVPIFEAPPLARALHRSVQIGDEIPTGLYVAVAKVLTYIFQLRAAIRDQAAAVRRRRRSTCPTPEAEERKWATAFDNPGSSLKSGIGVPLGVLAVLAMVILPLPPLALDVLFTFNIALSLVVLMAVFYVARPLDFGVFPSVLLLATLLRLALNVASTRVVLMHGHTGTGAAGQVIESFGEFVVGGNYAVGVVVFVILTVINFVVVTKGAGRISEVTARFTLDAMPGKQMAIDADLNAGLITQDEARVRRYEVRAEADFYGSMDGASKFARGDATAGIIILILNMIGGLTIGVTAHDMAFGDAARTYTLLTIGDGLVAQIPALLLSTAVAIIVTRMSRSQDMGGEISRQLFGQPKALYVAAAVIGVMGLIPGMPNIAFLGIAALCAGAGRMLQKKRAAEAARARGSCERRCRWRRWCRPSRANCPGKTCVRWICWAWKWATGWCRWWMPTQGGELLARVRGVRRKLTQRAGLPGAGRAHPRQPGTRAHGVSHQHRRRAGGRGRGPSRPRAGHQPGQGVRQGQRHRDHRSGLRHGSGVDRTGARDHAQTLGYTVVDPGTVIATHL